MKKINQKFAQTYNKDNDRLGYVFRDRYKSEEINDYQQLYITLAYIHFNPYRAGIINKLIDYKYSSYFDYINKKIPTNVITLLFDESDYLDYFISIHKKYYEMIKNQETIGNIIIKNYLIDYKIESIVE